jgi:hypothetical protein
VRHVHLGCCTMLLVSLPASCLLACLHACMLAWNVPSACPAPA